MSLEISGNDSEAHEAQNAEHFSLVRFGSICVMCLVLATFGRFDFADWWCLFFFFCHVFKSFDVVSLTFTIRIAHCKPVNFCMQQRKPIFFGLMWFFKGLPRFRSSGCLWASDLYEFRGLEVVGSGICNGQPSDVAGFDVFGIPQKALWPWLGDWHCDRELRQLREDAAN